jgi:hypothetical protein
MRRSLRRQLRFLHAYAIGTSLALVAVATAAFEQQRPTSANLDEVTVQRMNVVDKNGTLRLVIAGKDRMHPGVLDGRTLERERPVAGLIFFNDEGDEVGGLTYTGRLANGQRNADSGIMFDQLKQDQTIGIHYTEVNGRRIAALEVWDRSERPLGELIDKLNAANRIADPVAREAAVRAVRGEAPPAPRRVFVGKNEDGAATVSLADGNGKPRLTLTVDASGNPRIESLDADGKVLQQWPPTR